MVRPQMDPAGQLRAADRRREVTRAALALLLLLGGCIDVQPRAQFCAGDEAARASGETPTWYHDIAPLFAARCARCHQENGAAPFPLTDYADALAHKEQIAAAGESRPTPPWPVAKCCASY